MMYPTGNKRKSNARAGHGFTLIELILVMALLAVVMGVSFPSLQSFFHGRDLDLEARRFMAMTSYAQSRAVSESTPMIVWINTQEKRYGTRTAPGYVQYDTNRTEFTLARDLSVEVVLPTGLQKKQDSMTLDPDIRGSQIIRFYADGTINDTSPDEVIFRRDQKDMVWLAPSENRLKYVIQTNLEPTLAR